MLCFKITYINKNTNANANANSRYAKHWVRDIQVAQPCDKKCAATCYKCEIYNDRYC